MKIFINGEMKNIKNKVTLHNILSELELEKGFAVAINTTVIPKSKYLETWLNDNDKVEIVTAFYGG